VRGLFVQSVCEVSACRNPPPVARTTSTCAATPWYMARLVRCMRARVRARHRVLTWQCFGWCVRTIALAPFLLLPAALLAPRVSRRLGAWLRVCRGAKQYVATAPTTRTSSQRPFYASPAKCRTRCTGTMWKTSTLPTTTAQRSYARRRSSLPRRSRRHHHAPDRHHRKGGASEASYEPPSTRTRHDARCTRKWTRCRGAMGAPSSPAAQASPAARSSTAT